VIYAYGKAQDAIVECRAAIELDKTLGDAYYYKAICHADDGDYLLAISDMEEACRLHGHFEDKDKTVGARWISYWQEYLENFDEGIKVLEDALRQYPDDRETVTQYIELATKKKGFVEVLNCLRNLGHKLPQYLLSEKAEGIQRYIRRAAQMTRRVNSLKRAYQTALTQAHDEKETAIARRALFMILAENQEEDMAIDLFRKVYRLEDGPKQLGEWGRYIGNLCELLFWGLHLNVEGSEPFSNHLDLLVYAEKNEHSPDSNALTYDNYIAGLFLGQLYRLQNKLEESKVYFKDRVALAMSLLEDDDVSNDWQAYDILSETMFKAGDEVNGKAARIIFLHEWRKSQTDDTAIPSVGDVKNDAIGNKLEETMISDGGDTTRLENHKPDDDNGDAISSRETVEVALRVKTEATSVSDADDKIPVENSVISKEIQLDDTQVLTHAPQAAAGVDAGDKAANDTNVVDDMSADTPWDYSCCDGPCLRDYDKTDKMIHVCMNCYDTTYCDSCFTKYVFAGILPYKKCDPTHQFVSLTGPPKDLDDTKVVVGDNIRVREEWLNSIRVAWDLDEWHPTSPTLAISPTAEERAVTIEAVGETGSTKETE
jgi:tetratricopeptide (TPR) repeat protein